VLHELEGRAGAFEVLKVASSQHTDLLHPFAAHFGIEIDHDLDVMQGDQSPSEVASRVLASLSPILAQHKPDLLLVQGDTTTAMAGALAGFFHGVPVGHVEAGLRSGNPASPFPEEMNRRLITDLATLHFAATERNRQALLAEGVEEASIALTGNPVVDALLHCLAHDRPSASLTEALDAIAADRLLVLTTHRRESFGEVMRGNLEVLRDFVAAHEDVALAFPVHPNPKVVESTRAILGASPRVHLLEPLGYPDFIHLLSRAWLIVSDSGGVQEEAPTLGKALLILRENTERPEAIEAGVARLLGGSPEALEAALSELYDDDSWVRGVRGAPNPFGRGDAGKRISDALESFLDRQVVAKP
jgi:UDP-N-acetylglucosamine 2-epimerase (non-hydrolysing)